MLKSENIVDQELFVALTVFEILFIICFAVFFIFFLIRKKLTNDEYQIKNTFNDINQVSNIEHFAYLEILSKNNPQLENLMKDINASKKFFEEQLKLVKEKIMYLTEENEKFSFGSANTLRAQINDDLNSCLFMSEKIKKTMSNTTTYSKGVSDLLTQYRSITDDILTFYDLNLSRKYNNRVFVNIVIAIESTLSEVSSYVIKIDNNNLIKSLNKLNEHIVNFYNTVKSLYILDRTHLYLISSLAFIKKELREKSKMLSSNDSLEVEKRSALATTNINELEANLNNVQIPTAYNCAIIAIKNIEAAAEIIFQTDKINILIQKNIKYLSEQISLLTKQTSTISKTFETITNRFKLNDVTTVDKIKQITIRFTSVALSYQTIINEYKHYDTIQRNTFLLKIKESIEAIHKLKKDIDSLALEINSKYKDSIVLIDELADVKLTLAQLLGMKIKLNSSDEESMNSIRTAIKKVDQLEELINTDYFANYKKVYAEIQETKTQIFNIIKSCTFDNTLKSYAQRLFVFLNKYRNEAKEIDENLNLAERYYNKNKFNDTLDLLIETLKIIKYSSQINKVSFN
ncbi:MAG: septation ring formation regulator EzrA [Mycoplasmoidaceae bacterium]|nr:septation ring formation regulator EzrA [Mycoplasmoidaceae bacterium]